MKRRFVQCLQWVIERKLRVSVGYLSQLGEASFYGLLKLLLILPLAAHRDKCDRTLLHTARIVAVRHEGCGACLQMAVNAALDDCVPQATIRAILRRNLGQLQEPVALVVKYTEGVLLMDGSECPVRQDLETKYGAAVVAELALAIASARVFPTVKRGLGISQRCFLTGITVDENHPIGRQALI